MQLYAGTSQQFVQDTTQHRIAEKLKHEFFNAYRYHPSPTEVRSWQNSLQSICLVMVGANLIDQGVILEYQLPLSSLRLDVMLMGKNIQAQDNAIIVELKQWDSVSPTDADGLVSTYLGGKVRDILHPSVQVGQYQQYLEDCHTAFAEDQVRLEACGFLHNMQYSPDNELFAPRHSVSLEKWPIFCGDQTDGFAEYLSERVGYGDGQAVMARVLQSKYRPSKKLLEHTATMVAGQSRFILIDDQLAVLQRVVAEVRKAFHSKNKVVVLVKGGPGTGKSVVALHLVGKLAQLGFNAHHATGSKAFTGNVQKIVGRRATAQFKYFNSYMDANNNEIDILVLDEAHRLRASSASRFTPRSKQTGLAQIDELINASKVSVFFIDDLQIVRPNEVGSCSLIRESALRNSATLMEFELESQFRCGGSDGYINWIDNTLNIRRTANILWEGTESYDFQIVNSVAELETFIRVKGEEGQTARLTAGFCWPWSDPKLDGTLVNDVVVGEWSMPWNAKPDAGALASSIPTANFWASDPNGIEQVGCVYTAQGFEFDYAGVIFGRDLRYNLSEGKWTGFPEESFDTIVKRSQSTFTDLVKNTYRVLLTRGIKGTYVYFQDEDTRRFFQSRMDVK